MTRIAIMPVALEGEDVTYHAVSGEKRSSGKTAGAALDALTAQLSASDEDFLIIVQRLRPDRFFTAEQRKRLAELMQRWRVARDSGQPLTEKEQTELNALIEAELRATAARSASMAQELLQ